jgi:hypothetical protein
MKTWCEAFEAATLAERKTVRRWKPGVKFRAGLSGDRNQCAGCGEFFSSTSSFTLHRTGPFGKPPNRYADRKCIGRKEMLEKGMLLNSDYLWITGANPIYKNTDSSLA